MSLRISELCLPFSPYPNITDGNFNLVHHFFRMQIFQIDEKGARLQKHFFPINDNVDKSNNVNKSDNVDKNYNVGKSGNVGKSDNVDKSDNVEKN